MDSVYKNMFHSLLAEILHTGQDEDRNALAQFRREVAALLEPGETVEAVCGYGPCAAVTNRRFLVTMLIRAKRMDTCRPETAITWRMPVIWNATSVS